ncbi:MAG: MATE family efflux transporter [Isosphaeraceae bacterium]
MAIRCEAIAFLTVTAFAVPAGTLTGQYLGARRPDLAGRAARISWAMGCLILAALGVLLFTQAGPMFRIFLGGGKPAVSEAGVPVLRIVAFGMPALATINVLSGALRGAGDTRWPWLFAAIGYLGIRLPLTYVLARPETSGAWAFGLQGAWLAMLVDLYVRGALYAARFQGGRWREATV